VAGAGRGALTRFVADLRRLRLMAGSPSLNRLVVLSAGLQRPLRRSTISDKLNAKSLPEWDFVVSFTTACQMHAERAGKPLPEDAVDLARWDAAHWRMLQVVDRAHADERLAAAAKAEIGRRAGATPQRRGQMGLLAAPSQSLVPQQLPAAVRHFVGRAAELRSLNALVDEAAPDNPPVILAAEGTAGIGKSTLAVHWSHRIADRFPDGQLHVNLRGFDPTGSVVTPQEAIYGFLQALAVPPDQIPATMQARAALYRSRLAGKRMLVVLDNARDAEQVRPLLPGTPGCLVIVTSRSQLTSLVASEGAHWLTLNLLSPADARDLLQRRLGSNRLAAEPQAVDDIITACAGLPLALSIVAARAATHPGHPLAALADELRHAQSRLDALDGGSRAADVRSVFSWSYHKLDPPAAQLFRLLGLHPGPDIAVPAAASLAGRPAQEVRALLTDLARAYLLTEHHPNRYTFHDLLRAYAAELAHTCDSDTQRLAATRRLLDHYLHTAHAASLLLAPHRRERITPPSPDTGVAVAALADHEQALAWFAAEHPALLAIIELAAASGLDTRTYQLASALSVFLTRQGRWPEMVATQRTALDAALRLADRAAQAYAHRSIGMAAVELDHHDQANTHLRCALDLFSALGDLTGQAQTHLGFSRALERQGRHRQALQHSTHAHDLYQTAADQTGQANALNSIGWCHILLGAHREALAACQRALVLAQKTGNRWVEAATWDSLGHAHHHLGDHQQATACYQQALDLCRRLGDRHNEANTLLHLGDTQHAASNTGAARTAWQQALSIRTELNHLDTDQIATKLRQLDT
jgi:tetratricopeptide (TPR) repeat protein